MIMVIGNTIKLTVELNLYPLLKFLLVVVENSFSIHITKFLMKYNLLLFSASWYTYMIIYDSFHSKSD